MDPITAIRVRAGDVPGEPSDPAVGAFFEQRLRKHIQHMLLGVEVRIPDGVSEWMLAGRKDDGKASDFGRVRYPKPAPPLLGCLEGVPEVDGVVDREALLQRDLRDVPDHPKLMERSALTVLPGRGVRVPLLDTAWGNAYPQQAPEPVKPFVEEAVEARPGIFTLPDNSMTCHLR